ncbi:MAG: Gfo/Idh/MocA family oxidoreductase [Planctomycetota bacterium]|jgi:predicted dehydrogenase|nr:Gfo/Idh/MocA family oxidoreductase [Planctomycetota bacterium]
MTKPLNVALVGYGFMGKAHANAYRKVGHFFPELEHRPQLTCLCARDPDKAEKFAETWGVESVESDWRRVVERDDIDVIDICSPNNTHHDLAIAAAEAGKWVLCEKPLAMSTAEAEAMTAAVEKAAVPNMVWFNYRRVPAIALARQLVDEGRTGRPFHYRATYLQDWTIAPDLPQGGQTLWRLDVDVAGSGVTGDLLAHSIDTAMWLNGPIEQVVAATETFVKERVHQATGNAQPVGIDDACMFLARFANGSMGTFESTRYARGRKNYNTFELNGADGSVHFDLEDPQYLDFFEHKLPGTDQKVADHLTGWRRIHATNFEHPYMDHWWVPGCTIGYEHTFINALADFLAGVASSTPAQPDFRCALQTQKVCDAVLKSAHTGEWVTTGVEAE